MSLDAMKQALELLESAHVATDLVWKRYDCITALRAAIEQAQEPVAWHPIETAPKDRTVLVCRRHSTIPMMAKWNAEYEWFEDLNMDHLYDVTHWMPLPPAPGTSLRQWQGLTDEELVVAYGNDLKYRDGDYMRYARAIEAKLKEKNT